MSARRLTVFAGVFLLGGAILAATPADARAPRSLRPMVAGSQDFTFTGAPVNWTVPVDIHSIQATVCGASGENMLLGGSQVKFAGRPGHGGCVTASVSVTPGDVVHVRVGGHATASAGGWPDGGVSICPDVVCGGSGGGSSDIRIGGDGLTNRVLVGGGGGGGGGGPLGGHGGGAGGSLSTTGFEGADGGTGAGLPDDPNHPRGGIGGTLAQETRGCGVSDRTTHLVPQCVASEQVAWAYPPGHAGSGNKGADGTFVFSGATGGAGGGGYFGGGSGCAWNSNYDAENASLGACGGGGGSSYADPARTTEHFLTQGTANWYDEWLAGQDSRGDNGTVSISWPGADFPPVDPTIPATGSTSGALPSALAASGVGVALVAISRRRTA